MLNIWDAGTLFFIPAGATPTPVRVGGLQEVSLAFKTGVAPVRSQYRHPIRFTVDECAIEATAKQAKIDGAMFAEVVYGKSLASGSRRTSLDQAKAVPASAPYTVTPDFTGTFRTDLGAVKASDGRPFTRVASSPAAGQYALDEGIGEYTFAAADAGADIRLSLAYDSALGTKLNLSNEVFQFAPTFAVLLTTTFACKQVSLWLPAAVSKQLVIPTRLEQYAIPEFTFEAQMASDLSMGIFSFGE